MMLQPIINAVAYAIASIGDLFMIAWRFPGVVDWIVWALLTAILCLLTGMVVYHVFVNTTDVEKIKQLTRMLAHERLAHKKYEIAAEAKLRVYRAAAIESRSNELWEMADREARAAEKTLLFGRRYGNAQANLGRRFQ